MAEKNIFPSIFTLEWELWCLHPGFKGLMDQYKYCICENTYYIYVTCAAIGKSPERVRKVVFDVAMTAIRVSGFDPNEGSCIISAKLAVTSWANYKIRNKIISLLSWVKKYRC